MTQTNISHPELVSALVKPGATIAAEMTPQEADLWHAATGAMGEAVEILEAHMDALTFSRPVDAENVLEELGDMEFYLEQLRQNLSIDRGDTLEMAGAVPPMGAFPESCTLVVVVGRMFDAVKKVVIYKKPADLPTLHLYVSTIEMVMHNLRQCYDFTREQTLEGNIAKLSVRYSGLQYSNEAAQERADKA